MTISKPDVLTTDNSGKYKMSIRLSPDGFSFTGFIPFKGNTFFYEEVLFDKSKPYPVNLSDLFYECDFLSWDYRQVSIVINSPRYTLVPESIYREKSKEQILSFVYHSPAGKTLGYPVHEESLYIVYETDNDAYEFCSRSFLNPAFIPSIAPLISFWSKQNNSSPEASNLYVLMEEKQMTAILYAKGQLALANTYHTEKLEDVLYYTLYIWKQYGLDQEKDVLFLYGNPALRTQLQQVLHLYLRNIQQGAMPVEAYLLNNNLGRVPMDIIALSICG